MGWLLNIYIYIDDERLHFLISWYNNNEEKTNGKKSIGFSNAKNSAERKKYRKQIKNG